MEQVSQAICQEIINLTSDEKKIVSRIFSRLVPLIKGTKRNGENGFDIVDILLALPINIKIFSIYDDLLNFDNDLNNRNFYSVDLVSQKTMASSDINNITIEIDIFIDGSSDVSTLTQLENIMSNIPKVALIAGDVLKIVFYNLFKQFDISIRSKLVSKIIQKANNQNLSIDLNEANIILEFEKYKYFDKLLHELFINSGIYSYLKNSSSIFYINSNIESSFRDKYPSLDDYLDSIEIKIPSVLTIDEYTVKINDEDLSIVKNLKFYKTLDDPLDSENVDIIMDQMYVIRNQLIEKTQGSGSTSLLKELGISIEVVTDWMKELKGLIFTEANHYTGKSDISYRRIKNKFRHIAILPGQIHYENKLKAIIIIDQSGSVSDTEIRKINFIVEQLTLKAKSLHLIIHDSVIVDYVVFEGKMIGQVKDYIKRRRSMGGTCHTEAFQKTQEIIDNSRDDKFIVLTMSDMYSNIDSSIDQFDFLRDSKISKYWVCTEGRTNGASQVDGIKIDVQTGQLL